VFQKNSPLIPDVSSAIRKLQANGTIGKLTKRWFGYNPNSVPVLK
jgi:ABC-type amino acid transport substrate-binding protein